MIPKSGYRFSEKIMLQNNRKRGDAVIPLTVQIGTGLAAAWPESVSRQPRA
jgi:hypothetical protein